MEDLKKLQSRKKFLAWGVTALSSVTVFRFLKPPKKKKTETVKMLTTDGKLVEVNAAIIPNRKKKITNRELQNWIKKDKA